MRGPDRPGAAGRRACVLVHPLGAGRSSPSAWRRSSLLNRGFFAFLARRKGFVFAAAALPLHLHLLLLLRALGRDRRVVTGCCETVAQRRGPDDARAIATDPALADPAAGAEIGWARARLSTWRARSAVSRP